MVGDKRYWGYASGTMAGLLKRRYHGLLMATLKPPLGRTLLVTKLDETVLYDGTMYPLFTNLWRDSTVDPHGYRHIESFKLECAIPVWTFACVDALLEKCIWMQQGSNTTYVHYNLQRATKPLTLEMKALVNYRDYHGTTHGGNWQMKIDKVEYGICVTAYSGQPFYLLTDKAEVFTSHDWYFGFDLASERYKGLDDREDHLHGATFSVTLNPGESLTFVASTELRPDLVKGMDPNLNGKEALELRRNYEKQLIKLRKDMQLTSPTEVLDWINQLVLTADQFIVNRPLPNEPDGKTIIAGYQLFGDWGAIL